MQLVASSQSLFLHLLARLAANYLGQDERYYLPRLLERRFIAIKNEADAMQSSITLSYYMSSQKLIGSLNAMRRCLQLHLWAFITPEQNAAVTGLDLFSGTHLTFAFMGPNKTKSVENFPRSLPDSSCQQIFFALVEALTVLQNYSLC